MATLALPVKVTELKVLARPVSWGSGDMVLFMRLGGSEKEPCCNRSVTKVTGYIITAFEITIDNYVKALFPRITSGPPFFFCVVKPVVI